MLKLEEIKNFLKVDSEEDDALILSLKNVAKTLVEDIIRKDLEEFSEVPEIIKQAMLIIIATLYEERQISKTDKEGIDVKSILDIVRRMLFAYRKDKF